MQLFSWLATAVAAVLFFLSHPNVFFEGGVGPLGFLALVPVFLAVRTSSPKTVWLKGLLYGLFSYSLYSYWLSSFNPYTLYIAAGSYAVILAIVFLALKFFDTAFCRFCGGRFCFLAFFAEALLWCSYEYVKTLGFVGFSYGVLGYTQWKNTLLLQNAAWGGVWPLSFACAFFSAAVSSFLYSARPSAHEKNTPLAVRVKKAFAANRTMILFSLAILLLMYAYGAASLLAGGKRRHERNVKVVCVQNNADSEKYGVDVYMKDVKNLMELTQKALLENPDTALVVWPETAVVPPVEYHYQKRIDFDRVQIINRLLEFMQGKDCAFVIGNQRTVEGSGSSLDDYNAALVFDSALSNVIPPEPLFYEKIHLVPFAEWFPYRDAAPGIYQKLLLDNERMWTPGREYVVFDVRGVRFSVPICFEDTFGSLCRRFVRGGAEAFLNISNDSWSRSVPCQNQHLAMSVFRCAENRVPCARSTASGMTAFVDSFGRVVSQTAPFRENFLVCTMPLPSPGERRETLYTALGDWFAQAVLAFSCVLALLCVLHTASLRRSASLHGA